MDLIKSLIEAKQIDEFKDLETRQAKINKNAEKLLDEIKEKAASYMIMMATADMIEQYLNDPEGTRGFEEYAVKGGFDRAEFAREMLFSSDGVFPGSKFEKEVTQLAKKKWKDGEWDKVDKS